MKDQDKIPTSKVERTSKFVGVGIQMGSNYLKYYAKKLVNPNLSREELDKANADDIYNTLSNLKGSALKVAQMISMDENMLPEPYIQKFQQAQYNAPPLSYPLVVKTFRRSLGKSPEAIFDTFGHKAVNAASIGQVHQATLGEKVLAVKVQYPGVADSVSSDLRMAKPIALSVMNIKAKDLETYFAEVKERLLEETDYELELKRSIELTQKCKHLDNLKFPRYYPKYSSARIITMDWIEGEHLKDWIKTNPSQEERNKIGQALWDFYDFQIHELREVHADPHPGNFLITADQKLAIIDFGCVKVIPEDFYTDYFKLIRPGITKNHEQFVALLEKLNFFRPDDTPEEKLYFTKTFTRIGELLGRPFASEAFDFSNKAYFDEMYGLGDEIATDKQFRKSNAARGSRHGIYINRTYLGLYSLLFLIGATVNSKVDFNRPVFAEV